MRSRTCISPPVERRGILSYSALDLGDADAALKHAQAAWKLADMAENDELRASVTGYQSLIARFQKDYAGAARFIERA